ncbi:MAG: hypothetical protein NW224_04670 [Leptolyngbyaceae cyanobacterium bins.302]|nr:hypothetical protein [Leptolyngbyaceae cyanobacterium bins.302]
MGVIRITGVSDTGGTIDDCRFNFWEIKLVADNEKDIQQTEKEEVKTIKGENESVELSEDEMEQIAGGVFGVLDNLPN